MKLALGPSAKIDDSELLAGMLRNFLRSSEPVVELDLASVESVDVTFFQLLLALKQSLEKNGRRLVLSPAALPAAVRESALVLGLPMELLFEFEEAEQ